MDTDESTHMGVIWESNVFIYLQLLMGLPCGQSYVLGDAPSRENRPRLAMACEARLVPGAHQPMTSMTPTSTPHLAAVISRLRSRAYLKSIDFWQCIDLLFFFLFPLSRDHGPGNARSSTRRCRARPSLPRELHTRQKNSRPRSAHIFQICQLLLFTPVRTQCNHLLCASCMAQWADASSTNQIEHSSLDVHLADFDPNYDPSYDLEANCPMCRTHTTASPDKPLARQLEAKYPVTYAERRVEEEVDRGSLIGQDGVEGVMILIGNKHRLIRNPGSANEHLWTFFVRTSRPELIKEVHIYLVSFACSSCLLVKKRDAKAIRYKVQDAQNLELYMAHFTHAHVLWLLVDVLLCARRLTYHSIRHSGPATVSSEPHRTSSKHKAGASSLSSPKSS